MTRPIPIEVAAAAIDPSLKTKKGEFDRKANAERILHALRTSGWRLIYAPIPVNLDLDGVNNERIENRE